MNIGTVSINRPVLASVISIIIVLFGVTRTCACDCPPKPTIRSAVEGSHLVVHGKIIQAVLHKALQQDSVPLDSLSQGSQQRSFGPRFMNEYTVLVLEGYKGAEVNDTIVVRTGLDSETDCKLRLDLGSEYIIYAKSQFINHQLLDWKDESVIGYSTSGCSRTRSFARREAKAIREVIHITENVH